MLRIVNIVYYVYFCFLVVFLEKDNLTNMVAINIKTREVCQTHVITKKIDAAMGILRYQTQYDKR